MTPTDVGTVDDYVEHFLDRPDVALGPLVRLAQAFEAGQFSGIPEGFRQAVGEVALSLRPARPILACAADGEAALEAVRPLVLFASESGDSPAYTYSWKTGEDSLFACPYRHDPLLLLPEKSRHEVLAEASRSLEIAYPLALESKSHCPWCRKRYGVALARAGGVWQNLAAELVVHPMPEQLPENVCPAEGLMRANRGGVVFPAAHPGDLAEILRVVTGGGSWPPVTGLVVVPLSYDVVEAWTEDPEIAAVVEECWRVDMGNTA